MIFSSSPSRALIAAGLMILLMIVPGGHPKGAGTPLRLAQLRLPGAPLDPRPGALASLATELAIRTSINTDPNRVLVDLDEGSLFQHPFAVLPLEGALPLPADKHQRILSRWFLQGGTLLVDFSGDPGEVKPCLDSIARLAEIVLPGSRLERLPASHVLFRTFYRLRRPTGRIQVFPELYGVRLRSRLAIIVSLNDLLGAWDRTRGGGWRFRAVPGGDRQREKAIRLGVNLVNYVLCLDYKNEKVHLDYLRTRRNWRLEGAPGETEVQP